MSLLPATLAQPLLVAIPAGLVLGFLVLSAYSFLIKPLSERAIARHTQLAFLACGVAAALLLIDRIGQGAPLTLDLNTLVHTGHGLLVPSFRIDLAAASVLTLFMTILGLVGRYSATYLHREPGYERFFLLLWLFSAGVAMILTSARADFLLIGWELVGLTSVLLIGFFREREQPVLAGMRAWITYRSCDIALILAIVGMHHEAQTVDWSALYASAPSWTPGTQWAFGLLLIIGAMGKSAQAPLSGWLPRAMEGPTPSSALFYGAISVHLGAWLLLMARPIIATQPGLLILVAIIGASTAFSASVISRTRPDIKSALGWATVAQLGVIWIEIAAGFTTLAVIHILTHALLRTVQLLRAPMALHDIRARHAASQGAYLSASAWTKALPASAQQRLYAIATSNFHMDALLQKLIIAPVMGLSRSLDRMDQGFAERVAGADHDQATLANGEQAPNHSQDHSTTRATR